VVIGLHFEGVCGLLGDQHKCVGVLCRWRYLSWFAQFRKELSMTEKV